jgi:hypothetical protein
MAKVQPKNVDEEDFETARKSGSLARDLADSKRLNLPPLPPTENEADFSKIKKLPGLPSHVEPGSEQPPPPAVTPPPVLAGTGWWYVRLDDPNPRGLAHKEMVVAAKTEAEVLAVFCAANGLSYSPRRGVISEHNFVLHEVATPDPADPRVWPRPKVPEPELATAGV